MYTVAKISDKTAIYLSSKGLDAYHQPELEEHYTYTDTAEENLEPDAFTEITITEYTNTGTLPIDPSKQKPMFPRK